MFKTIRELVKHYLPSWASDSADNMEQPRGVACDSVPVLLQSGEACLCKPAVAAVIRLISASSSDESVENLIEITWDKMEETGVKGVRYIKGGE